MLPVRFETLPKQSVNNYPEVLSSATAVVFALSVDYHRAFSVALTTPALGLLRCDDFTLRQRDLCLGSVRLPAFDLHLHYIYIRHSSCWPEMELRANNCIVSLFHIASHTNTLTMTNPQDRDTFIVYCFNMIQHHIDFEHPAVPRSVFSSIQKGKAW